MHIKTGINVQRGMKIKMNESENRNVCEDWDECTGMNAYIKTWVKVWTGTKIGMNEKIGMNVQIGMKIRLNVKITTVGRSKHKARHLLKNLTNKSQLNRFRQTFCVMARAAASTVGGSVLGMARIIVRPPANAALVHELQSSLWVAPGSRTWTWTSIRPGKRRINKRATV